MSAPIGYYDVSNMSSKFHINISVFVWFAQTNHGVLYCIYYTSFCMVKLHPISRQLSPLRGHAFPKPVLCSKETPASAGNAPPAEASSSRSIIRPKHHPSKASSVSPRSPSAPGPSAPPAGPLPSRSPPWPPKAVPAAGWFPPDPQGP